jgi:hypothetical protein
MRLVLDAGGVSIVVNESGVLRDRRCLTAGKASAAAIALIAIYESVMGRRTGILGRRRDAGMLGRRGRILGRRNRLL